MVAREVQEKATVAWEVAEWGQVLVDPPHIPFSMVSGAGGVHGMS